MNQCKKDSHKEVMSNQMIGIVLGWMIVYFLFPFFEHLNQFWVASISTVIFFVSSYTRSYILRRVFNEKN